MTQKTALIAGASGLVGGYCLREILENPQYDKVISLVRTPQGITHPKLREIVVDFDLLEKFIKNTKANAVYCCLGTTRQKTPSLQAYRKVDFEYVLSLAKISLKNGSRQFLVVSSMGANPNSSLFYSRLKGEMEEAVSAVPFQAVHIMRPSFILGEKDRKERRPSERFMEKVLKPLSPLFIGPFKKYRPIQAQTIAKAMVNLARQQLSGVHIWESHLIEKQANQVGQSKR